ncbi:MAG: hypothetical protein HZA01_00115 [Nitrospinae bacterium]|nr:hypothetical protein [Nitrospinota bacterium]
MAATLPLEIYELLEKKVGRDEAKEVIKIIDASLETIEKKAEGIALQKKLEIKDELTKELATKADLLVLKAEMSAMKTELERRIDNLNQKLNFMIILMIIALTLMNPVMAEVIKGLLK